MNTLYRSPDVAEGTTAAEPEKAEHKVKVLDVEVNGVTFEIFEQKQTRGKGVGEVFLATDLDKPLSAVELEKAFGEKLWDNFIRPNWKRLCNGITKAAAKASKGDDETFKAKFLEYFRDLSSAEESVRALKLRMTELLKEMSGIDPTKDVNKFVEVATKIREINIQIEELKEEANNPTPEVSPETPQAQAA